MTQMDMKFAMNAVNVGMSLGLQFTLQCFGIEVFQCDP